VVFCLCPHTLKGGGVAGLAVFVVEQVDKANNSMISTKVVEQKADMSNILPTMPNI
jgi:hypothetical protein